MEERRRRSPELATAEVRQPEFDALSASERLLVEATQKKLRRQRVIFFSVAAALGGFLFGYDTAVINGAVAAVQQHYQAGALALGASVASALIGSAIGAWFTGQIADRIGRVRTMLLASGLFVIGSLGTGFALSLVDFSAWRIVGGLAVGIASVVARRTSRRSHRLSCVAGWPRCSSSRSCLESSSRSSPTSRSRL